MSFRGDERVLTAFSLVAGLAVALTALAAYAFAVPEKRSETETFAHYEQQGSFSYAVSGQPSALNPTGSIGPISAAPGETTTGLAPPIFTRLADRIDFTYTYRLETEAIAYVKGTLGANLDIQSDGAWSQSRELVPPVAFAGKTAALEGGIDLREIGALLTQIEDETGSRSSGYRLVITPVVTLEGTLAGEPVETAYGAPFTFAYTSTQITPDETLATSQPGQIGRTETAGREIGLGGSQLPVATVRQVAAPLAALALVLTCLLGAVVFLGLGRGDAAKVRARYRSLLVPVSDVQSAATHRISVESISALAQMAKRESRSLFVRQFDDESSVYFVHDGLVIYQYATGNVPEDWLRAPGVTETALGPALTELYSTPPPGREPEPVEELPSWLTGAYDDAPPRREESRAPEPEPAVTAALVESVPAERVEEAAASTQNGHNGHNGALTNGHAPSLEAASEAPPVEVEEAAAATIEVSEPAEPVAEVEEALAEAVWAAAPSEPAPGAAVEEAVSSEATVLAELSVEPPFVDSIDSIEAPVVVETIAEVAEEALAGLPAEDAAPPVVEAFSAAETAAVEPQPVAGNGDAVAHPDSREAIRSWLKRRSGKTLETPEPVAEQPETPAEGSEASTAETAASTVSAQEPSTPPVPRVAGLNLPLPVRERHVSGRSSVLFTNGHEPNRPVVRDAADVRYVPGYTAPSEPEPQTPLDEAEASLPDGAPEVAVVTEQPGVVAEAEAAPSLGETVPEAPAQQPASLPEVPSRRRPAPIEQRLADSARRWLRDFLDTPPR